MAHSDSLAVQKGEWEVKKTSFNQGLPKRIFSVTMFTQ